MRFRNLIRICLVLPLIIAGTGAWAGENPRLERVRVSADGKGFVAGKSGKAFRPWGVNYGNAGRLMEDFWETDWQTLADDFREMRELGSNVVRVHLQFVKFMTAPDRPDPKALERLGRLLRLAEETGLYLDLTGLACYRKSDVPAWYDRLSEEERWDAQARFWQAIARRCAGSSAVFCYDLINEPLSPAEKRAPGDWYSGKPLGGLDFLQYIALDPAGRERAEIARQWVRHLVTAIRKHDRKTLITVGMLPSIPKWGHFSGFVPEKIGPEVDFISVHIYPEKGKVEEAVETLKGFAVGKPVVIEETFPLSCSAEELEAFMLQSRSLACGWIGHYDGRTQAEYEARKVAKTLTLPESVWLAWIELSRKLKPQMVGD